MDIPAHRAAAVVPTPAHSFELREGGQLVNLTEEERAASEIAAAAVAASTTEVNQPATPAEEEQAAADAVDSAAAVPVRAPKGRRPATDAPAQSAQTAE